MENEMVVVVTRFKLRQWRKYPNFFRVTARAFRQARRADGILLAEIKPLSLYTLSVWESRQAMVRFRNSGFHLQAMKQSDLFGSTKSVTWRTDRVPNWKEAIAHFHQESG